MSKIICAAIHDKAIVPSKEQADAGYDLYAIFNRNVIAHLPHEVIMHPTGIKTAFATTHVALIQERGSTGTKGMEKRAGVIEGNYRGEWFVPITNGTNKEIFYINTEDFGPSSFLDIVSHFVCAPIESHILIDEEGIYYEGLKNQAEVAIHRDMKTVDVALFGEVTRYTIYPQNKAIAQFILIKKEDWEVEVVTEESLMEIESSRGEGRLGSSGK